MAITNPTVVTITENVTDVTVTGQETISIELTQSDVTVEVNNFVLPNTYQDATNTVVAPTGSLTATNVQAALEDLSTLSAQGAAGATIAPIAALSGVTTVQAALVALASISFQTAVEPSGATLNVGDTWYDTANHQFKIYRETSVGVFEWAPVILGTPGQSSDQLDAGAF